MNPKRLYGSTKSWWIQSQLLLLTNNSVGLSYRDADSTFKILHNSSGFLPKSPGLTMPIDEDRTSFDHSYNSGYLDNPAIAVPMGVSLYALSLLTFVGNAMVLHAIRTERRLQTVSNMFIMSLAVADLTVGIIVMPISSAYAITGDWMFGIVVCQFWLSMDYTASTASILNLFILSLDRYWSIRSPLKYLRKRTKKRALLMIGIAWLLSAMWIVPIIGWHYWYNDGVRKQPKEICETEFADNVLFKLSTSTANFYVPMVLMICLYARIFHEIKKRSKFEIGQCNTGGGGPNDERGFSVEDNVPDQTRPLKSTRWKNGRSLKNRDACEKQIPTFSFDDEYEDYEVIDKRVGLNCSRNNDFVKVACSRKRHENYGSRRTCIQTTSRGSNISSRFPKQSSKDREFRDMTVVIIPSPEYSKRDLETVIFKQNFDETGEKMEFLPDNGTNQRDTMLKGAEVSVNYPTTITLDKKRTYKLKDSREAVFEMKSKLCQPNIRKSQKTFFGRKKKQTNQSLELVELYSSPKPSRRQTDKSRCIDDPETVSLNHQRSLERFDSVPSRSASRLSFRPGTRFLPNLTSTMRMRVTRKSMASSLRQEKKAARQLGVIMGAFVLCWLPYIISFIVTAYCEDCIDPKIHIATSWLGYLNSTMNPFLYALCNDNFKRSFKKMFRRGSINSMFFPASANAKPDHLFA
ncbi:histamine H1 receptor-like [Tachypleus tridentatus]|uniref:histamine H1 receptor-like n=1 Tax=Tachypleus tridentatus TaxID=6853 RepID=UPI003FD413C0